MKPRAKYRRDELRALNKAMGLPSRADFSALMTATGLGEKSVQSYLSDGFPAGHIENLRIAFEAKGIPFNHLHWGRDVDIEDDRLVQPEPGRNLSDQLLVNVRTFLCIRAPAPYPRLPQGDSPPIDERGLVSELDWAAHAKTSRYIGTIWEDAKKGLVEGTVITAVGRISALVELWASVELLRKNKLLDKIAVYLVRSDGFPKPNGNALYFPMVGARVINDRRCLLNVPETNRNSRRTPIIESDMTVAFIRKYAEDLMAVSRDLTRIHTAPELIDIMRKEFALLVERDAETHTQYGLIDSFEKVQEMMSRLCRFADDGKWFPPLA